ncbi:MAG: thioredoxin-disulfide reductase [Candidatus Rehaiarchaeum fermentans]|nr:thioredoxin-disulfide reductase [Candidatus Rehaiarchaeum fermentans]
MEGESQRANQHNEIEKLIIIGGGPAAYSAAIYGIRSGLNPLIFAGYEHGGQLLLTTYVEDFPSYPSILGPDLMKKMEDHVVKLGGRIVFKDAEKVDLSSYPFKVSCEGKDYFSYSLIIATGAKPRWLGLPNEQRLIGKGVSNCAVCDGFFFKGKKVAVVGGGDTAMEDASYLANLASEVYLIHRRDTFRAVEYRQEKVKSNPKIKIIYNSVVTDVLGNEKVEGIKIKNLITGEEQDLEIQGLFVAIGHDPNTALFKGQLEMDNNGYIITTEFTKTSKEGVFAAGDVVDKKYRQAIVAAGWGAMAALDAREYLSNKKLN